MYLLSSANFKKDRPRNIFFLSLHAPATCDPTTGDSWKGRSFTAFLAFCRCEQPNSYVGAGWVALAWVELTSGVKMPSWLGRCCNTEHNSRAPATEIWTAELNAALVQSPSPSLGWALSLPFCAYLPSWSSTNSFHCTSSQKCWVQYSCEAV